ncbi:MAG: carbonic anhydrase family protein [Epsilonproteobacteria bacterium]|nr:carbonic anhydrase family protein [Campylobacterota bacterium]
MKLNKVIVGSLLVATALLANTHESNTKSKYTFHTYNKAHKTTHWGYTGHGAPSNWGDLKPEYQMCKLGSSQSPINIASSVTVESSNLADIKFEYKSDSASVVNNGHTVQVNIKNGSSIEIDGIVFELKQFHFHTPSENQIEGKNFPLEAHFVHASKDGKLAVVALMFEDGVQNPIINKIWHKVSHKVNEKKACNLSSKVINDLLPKDKSYYRFSGSLTTPPCSEGVRWFVLKNYSHISASQTSEFLHMMHHENNRPIQAINARKVMK